MSGALVGAGIGLALLGFAFIAIGLMMASSPPTVETGLDGWYPMRTVETQKRVETAADVIKRTALAEDRFKHVDVHVTETLGGLLVSLSGPVETDNDVFDARVNVFVRAVPALKKKVAGVWIGGLSPRVPSVTQTWDVAPGVPSTQVPRNLSPAAPSTLSPSPPAP